MRNVELNRETGVQDIVILLFSRVAKKSRKTTRHSEIDGCLTSDIILSAIEIENQLVKYKTWIEGQQNKKKDNGTAIQ